MNILLPPGLRYSHMNNKLFSDFRKNITRQLLYWQVLNSQNIGVPLLATFRNGFVMHYAAGRHFQANLTWTEWSMIAKTVAEFHAVKLPDDMLQDARNERFQFVESLLDFHHCPDDEKNHIQSLLKNSDFKLSLCHGDLHLKNFVYNQWEDRLYLIDFETVFYGWAVYDWAVLFLQELGESHLRGSRETRIRWETLEIYLKHNETLKGKTVSIITSNVRNLYIQVLQMENIIIRVKPKRLLNQI